MQTVTRWIVCKSD